MSPQITDLKNSTFKLVVSSPGRYCIKCMKKAVDFTHVLVRINQDGTVDTTLIFCPTCKNIMRRIPEFEQKDNI